MTMSGCSLWNAVTSAFHCASDLPPLSVLSGGQSTTIVVLPEAVSPDLSLLHAAAVSPTEATSAIAATFR